ILVGVFQDFKDSDLRWRSERTDSFGRAKVYCESPRLYRVVHQVCCTFRGRATVHLNPLILLKHICLMQAQTNECEVSPTRVSGWIIESIWLDVCLTRPLTEAVLTSLRESDQRR